MGEIKAALRDLLGEKGFLDAEQVRERASTFWHRTPMQAQAILRPQSIDEVAGCLRLCHQAKQPLIPLGGNTGLVEATAATANDMMLSLERMTAIEPIESASRTVVVEAGVILQQLQQSALDSQLYFPVDFGARGSCTIGGMIATNAGGFNVLRYGMMRQRVLGLEAVLADGTVLSSLNPYIKNNTGYDLKQLFIGSEGTLGIVTRATLQLEDKPSSCCSSLIAVTRFQDAIALLRMMRQALGECLTAIEIMWEHFFAINTGPHSPHHSPFQKTYPFYLLIDASGSFQQHAQTVLEAALTAAYEQGVVADAVVSQSVQDANALWAIREHIEAEEQAYAYTYGYDVSLAIPDMETFIRQLEDQLKMIDTASDLLVFGHMADGNLHITIGTQGGIDREQADQLIYRQTHAYGGAISAEHGIGLEKKPYLHYSRHPDEIGLMRRIKQVFDPHHILNPGKIFDHSLNRA